jgi:RND family efflux transporter MFP subunit
MKRLARRIAAVAGLASWAAAVCAQSASPSATPAALELETATVVARQLAKTVTIPGELEPFQEVDLNAKVTGFVESLAVDRGSSVKRGQLLGTLSAPELRAQRAEAQAKLEAVRAQQAEAAADSVVAQSRFDRLEAASATPGVVAGHDLEIAERGLEAAKAHVAAVEASALAAAAALDAVSEMEAYLRLTAPFDGVVTRRNVHPGTLVGPATSPLLRIEQVSKLRLTVPVPETYLGAIETGVAVDFSVAGHPGRTFAGTIARPAQSLDTKTRSMMVELDVENADRALAPGMFAEVAWPITRSQPSLFVPRTAVVRTSERQFVVRVREGAAEWVDVRRGELVGDALEVFGELREGDVVVRRGSDEIRPGTRIAPAPAKES